MSIHSIGLQGEPTADNRSQGVVCGVPVLSHHIYIIQSRFFNLNAFEAARLRPSAERTINLEKYITKSAVLENITAYSIKNILLVSDSANDLLYLIKVRSSKNCINVNMQRVKIKTQRSVDSTNDNIHVRCPQVLKIKVFTCKEHSVRDIQLIDVGSGPWQRRSLARLSRAEGH